MDISASAHASVPPDRVQPFVDDLGVYPQWLSIVHSAERVEGADAWWVQLRARVGPLARSKRLRMVRSECEPGRHVRFERAETDGRRHAPWCLDVWLAPTDGGTDISMNLHYGGRLWSPLLAHVLESEVEAARPRLVSLAEADEPTR